MPTPNSTLGFTYDELFAMLQAWPVNASAEYMADLPSMVNMAELRLYKDLNLDIFDPVDQSFTLTVGNQIVTKPVGLVQLRNLRVAAIISTVSNGGDPVALAQSQATSVTPTSLIFNGNLGAAPVTINPAAQLVVAETVDSIGGITVSFAGNDQAGMPATEDVVTIANTPVTTATRFASVASMTVQNGSVNQFLKVGTAPVASSVLGASENVEHRSKAFCDAFNDDASVTGLPRYYCELSQTQWQVVPAANMAYKCVLHFIKRPESIVTAGTSWLGDNVGELLFAATLMEAERYIKADDRWDDINTDYQTKLATSKAELAESIRMGNYSPYKPAATEAQ